MTVIPVVDSALGTVPLKKRDYLYQGIVKMGQNTKKSPGDLRRLAVTQTPVKELQLILVWKIHKEENNNCNRNNNNMDSLIWARQPDLVIVKKKEPAELWTLPSLSKIERKQKVR